MLDGRWEEVGLFFEARIIADELTFAVSVRVEELERATFEEGVDHLEQEVRIAPNAGHEFTAHVAYASPHPKARLDEAHLLVGRESAQFAAHHAFEVRLDALVGAGDK